MGKKAKKPNHLMKPFVSICTPTFNRRPFIKMLIKCFENQTYPKDRMEWIIIDDGTDKIEDLVKDIPEVKYFKYDEQMILGKKRNLMHEKCSGDIIIYMDDDDYYPPERVSHAVQMLLSHPKALCAGSSELYIYFKHINCMYKFGPYGEKHATAGTFAFKKELLKTNSYNEEQALAEEKHFLNNYTVPFVQLEPKKTILVFSHLHNTFDKKQLLENKNKFINISDKTVDYFIKDESIKNFYLNIDKDLENYKFGLPENKPEVLKQTQELIKNRQHIINNITNNDNKNNNSINYKMENNLDDKFITLNINGNKTNLDKNQTYELIKSLNDHVSKLEKELKIQESIINTYRENKLNKYSMDDITHEDMKIINQINN